MPKQSHTVIALLFIIALVTGCDSPPTATTVATPTQTPVPAPSATLKSENTSTQPPAQTAEPTTVPLPTPKSLGLDKAWLDTINIAFYNPTQGLNLAQVEGERLFKISSDNLDFSQWNWSPDGTMLAYGNFNGIIKLMNLAQGNYYQLDQRGSFAWHPNGSYLVVQNSKTLSLIDASTGGEIAQLTLRNWEASGFYAMMSFAPDGKRLALSYYTRLVIVEMQMDDAGNPIGFGAQDDISGTARQWYVNSFSLAQWSPAGDRLAVMGSNWPSQSQVYILSPEGNLRSQVKLDEGWVQEFRWSPDGAYLAIVAVNNMWDSQLFIANNLGENMIKLDSGNVGCPSWVPGSAELIYSVSNHAENLNDRRMLLILTDAAGIQKKILPLSSTITDPANTVCARVRPNTTIKFTPIPTATVTPACGALSPLQIGQNAIVTPGDANLVRSEPVKGNNVIATIPAGTIVKIIEGPVCADGLIYWKVANDTIPGGEGWTAEGNGKTYWLEPYQP